MAIPYDLEPGEVRVIRHGRSDRRVATILPGVGYSVDMPLLYFTGRALLQREWTVDEVWWRPPEVGTVDWATGEVNRLVRRIGDADRSLIVAKSLGTLALPMTVGTRAAGIWLTPLLDVPRVAAAASALDDRHLLIGGTADKTWTPRVAESSSAVSVSIDGANHGLELPDTCASVGVLARVLDEVSAFLDRLAQRDGTGER